jgi:hypothetical protein
MALGWQAASRKSKICNYTLRSTVMYTILLVLYAGLTTLGILKAATKFDAIMTGSGVPPLIKFASCLYIT